MENQTSMPVPQAYMQPAPANDLVLNFELIVGHFQRGILLVPEHQRAPDAWKADKRRKYVQRLRDSKSGRQPLGTFATYQVVDVDGRAGPQYLNDGLQRLTTLAELVARPEDYDMDAEGVSQLLLTAASVQHRHYPSHEDAMKDFQYVNFGTHLTAYELCHGYLDYMPEYERRWRPLLDRVKRAVEHAGVRVGAHAPSRREKDHKFFRHDFALFYRFLSKEREPVWYRDIGRTDVQEFVDRGDVVELRLREALLKAGVDDSTGSVAKFEQFVAREVALLEDVRDEVLSTGRGLQAVLWRWLLDFAVWRRITGITVEKQREFVVAVLKATDGQGQIRTEDGKTAVSFGLGNLSTLSTVTRLVDMPDVCHPARRRNGKGTLRPGYQHSHQEPFAVVGDGPTVPEPGSMNMARGAKPMAG